MGVDQAEVERTVRTLLDPELGLPLGELGMVRRVQTRRRRADIVLAVPLRQWPRQPDLERQVREAVSSIAGVEQLAVEVSVMDEPERMELRQRLRREMSGPADDAGPDRADGSPGGGDDNGHDHGGHDHGGHDHGGHDHGGQEAGAVPRFLRPESKTRVVGISSGKGGVGKSSITVNLAVALARSGHRVGVLDADVYGFSVPKMLGTENDPLVLGDTVVPTEAHGVRCLSIGYFVPDDQPVIWRGPMLHKAIDQFLTDAYWGEPDFLLVDMPPGTGDVTLSLAQVMPRTEVVVVTTPQAAAQRVAQRSAFAARKLKLSVRGVIENMSWFTSGDGVRHELFGAGGGELLAKDLGVPLLGRVPLVPRLREGGDIGIPVALSDPDGEAATVFESLADRLASMGPARVYRKELALR